MAKLDEQDIYKLEQFARALRNDIDEFKKFTKLIAFTDEQSLINEAAIEILERKYQEMIEAPSYKKLNKVIRLKKVIGEEDGEE